VNAHTHTWRVVVFALPLALPGLGEGHLCC
jgi:hypothetical protein